MAFQNLLLPIVSVFRSVGIQAARGALGGLGKDFDTFAKQAGKAGMAFAGMQAILSGTQFITQSVEMTQRFERNMLALEQVFEQITPRMEAFTKAAANNGVSQSQAAQASVYLGSVLKQYGLDVTRSADETERLVLLAQDLATTYGYDLSEALVAITALFRGEYDPIEKFGVAMKQSEINAYLAARGLDDLEGSALLLEQVQARLTLLYERSAVAQGAFTRASDTLYASQQKLNAQVENLMVAFGTPLQGPLAEITDMFANLAEDVTPKLVSIADTLAVSLEAVGPMFVSIVELGGNLLILLVPLIATLSGLAAILNLVVTPLAKFLSYITDLSTDILSGAIEDLSDMHWNIGALAEDLSPGFLKAWDEFWNKPSMFQYKGSELERLINLVVDFSYWISGAKRDTFEYNSEQKRFELQAERSATALIALKAAGEETAPALTYMQKELEFLGIYSLSAEKNLIGLAGIFDDIDTAARKSNASKALDDIGFSAGQIETILTKPDWYQIFAEISAAAALASQDISAAVTSGNFDLVNQIMKAQGVLKTALEGISDQGGPSGAAPQKPRDAVKALLNELRDETNKQAARLKLAAMGASKGLIELILGDKDWSKLWQQIKTGIISLDGLQKKFNNTAAGVQELEDALKAASDEAQDYIDKQQQEADRLEQIWIDATARANDFKKAIADVSTIEVLPTISKELGRFEQQIVSMIQSIRDQLKQGLESGAIYEPAYKELLAYVDKESALLQAVSRQRDDLANRYSLSEALIKEYKSALTSSLSLTSLFSALKKETEKRTVTEVTRSVAQLSGNLKQFNVTVTREYEETIDKVMGKTDGLVQGFRDMAAKARGFADNLKKLKELGLDPMLFDQLVQAGVEAGGETAQALVDGGASTISEINGLFDEINTLGAELGEDVAKTLYDTGNEFGDNLLEGIAAKQSELEALARAMAEAFNKEFQAKVSVAAAAPVTAAENAFNAVVVPKLEDIDIAGLAQLNAYLENAGAALSVVTGATTRAGIESKIDVVELLKKDLLAGAKLDLSGIQSGMSSSALLAAAQATGSTTVNNYYTTIQPGDRLSQNSTVEALQTFANANGSISSWVAI